MRRVTSGLSCAVAMSLLVGLISPASARVIGESVRDRPLRVENIGPRERSTRVLIVGCFHGNECAGRAVVRELREMRRPRSYELWVSWTLNPDGSAAGTRQNARGVDLNRNFGAGWRAMGSPWDTYYSGPHPFSEPETRAARRFIKAHRPDITIWYHQAMRLVARMPRHTWVQRRYARRVGLPLERLGRYPGTAPRWQNRRFPRHTSFVVELPAGSLSEESARRHAVAVRLLARIWNRRRG